MNNQVTINSKKKKNPTNCAGVLNGKIKVKVKGEGKNTAATVVIVQITHTVGEKG